MSETPILIIEKDQIPVSHMSRTPTVSIIKVQIPVRHLNKCNKGPDTSQGYEKNRRAEIQQKVYKRTDTSH